MKIKMKFCVLSGALLVGSLFSTTYNANEVAATKGDSSLHTYEASSFKDVATSHYAYEAVYWAKEKGIVSGYTTNGKANGLFGPDDSVTEAQFVKMVVQYLELQDDKGDILKGNYNGAHWSDYAYDAIAKYEVPLRGYLANKDRDTPMLRGSVAQALGYLIGNQKDTMNSIRYLMAKQITNGQNPQFEKTDLHEFFGSGYSLTRAHVVTFLHRMEQQDLKQISELAMTASKNGTPLGHKAFNTHFKADWSFDKPDIPAESYNDQAYMDYLKSIGVEFKKYPPIYAVEGINAERGDKIFND